MALPWLQIIDAVLGVANFTRGRAFRADVPPDRLALSPDSRRLELERMAMERERAERALNLELLRQAGDREIGRLRVVALVAVIAWVGTLLVSTWRYARRAGRRRRVLGDAARGAGLLVCRTGSHCRDPRPERGVTPERLVVWRRGCPRPVAHDRGPRDGGHRGHDGVIVGPAEAGHYERHYTRGNHITRRRPPAARSVRLQPDRVVSRTWETARQARASIPDRAPASRAACRQCPGRRRAPAEAAA